MGKLFVTFSLKPVFLELVVYIEGCRICVSLCMYVCLDNVTTYMVNSSFIYSADAI